MNKSRALCLCAALLGPSPALSEAIPPQSVYVIDGDTVDVSGQRFRLVGFDTPETYRARCDYELALGRAATRRLRELVGSGQLVELFVLPGRDRYGRGLASLRIGGVDVGKALISEGLARAYHGGKRAGWC